MPTRAFAFLLLLLPAFVTAQTYRWTDDQGRTQYTQTPPRDGRPFSTLGAPPPPASAPNQESLNRSLEDSRKAPAAGAEEADQAAQLAARREQQCQEVQQQLAYLDNTPANRMRKADAQQSRVSAAEHAQRRGELQKHLDEHCS